MMSGLGKTKGPHTATVIVTVAIISLFILFTADHSHNSHVVRAFSRQALLWASGSQGSQKQTAPILAEFTL